VSAALRALVTTPLASDRLSDTALKPATSDSIILEMAQTAALSLALLIVLPVEISFCVVLSDSLIPFSVCRATIAPLLVRMLDMFRPPCDQAFCTVGLERPSDQGGCPPVSSRYCRCGRQWLRSS